MPNATCERCERNVCRTKCVECAKYTCHQCRLSTKHLCLICYARRQIPVEQSLETVYVNHSRFGKFIQNELSRITFPTNLVPNSVKMNMYRFRDGSVHDTYTRIGKHYYCIRDVPAWNLHGRVVPMHMTLEQKQDIVAGAMHPKRFGRLLDEWGEGVFDYFGR